MNEVVAVDIGGTHARFALASIDSGRVAGLGEAITLKTGEFASFAAAWEAFGKQLGQPLPRAAAIAIAAPVSGDEIRLTNSPWLIRQASFGEHLGVDAHVLVNDFEAVGHAVCQAAAGHFFHICGPDRAFGDGTISIIGPGTGLGVAHIRRAAGDCYVQSTEGGHIDFAALDAFEDDLLRRLRARHGRVSVERIVSGPGLISIFEALAAVENLELIEASDKTVWDRALSNEDDFGNAALDRFCMTLGSVAGDIALAQGGFAGVVIAGGIGLRLKDVLPRSGFAERFRAKGRFEGLMASIPVKLITHPQPGLFGAAAAFAKEHS